MNRPTKSLKHLFQESNMPPWVRDGLPLIFIDHTLILVPGLGISSELKSKSSEMGLVIELTP